MRAMMHNDSDAAEFSEKLIKIGEGELEVDKNHKLHKIPCGQFVKKEENLAEKVFQI